MKSFYHLLMWTLLISACTNQSIIITDQYAYSPSDDTLAVAEGYNDILHPNITSPKNEIDTVYDTLPIVLKREDPEYPTYHVGESSYLIEANVMVKVIVTNEGIVERAYILKSSEKTFNKSCLKAAMQWKFRPAVQKGKPVSFTVGIPFRFRLQK